MSKVETVKIITKTKLLKGYFADIPYGGSVLIYGSGAAGSKLFDLLQAVRPDIEVKGYVDSFQAGQKGRLPVHLPDDIRDIEFNCVIVASAYKGEICTTLTRMNVEHFILDDAVRDHPNPIELYSGHDGVDEVVERCAMADDQSLLELFVKDCMESEELYRPTNYWETYSKLFTPELQQVGLFGLKQRIHSVLGSFSGSDTLDVLLQECADSLQSENRGGLSYEGMAAYFYRNVKRAFNEVGLDMSAARLTDAGSPSGLLRYATGEHNISQLQHAKFIADAAKHIRLHNEMVFCELGGGIGRVPEILANHFDGATFLLFDIPPQVYVQHQYLSSVFGDRVVHYRDLCEWNVSGDALERAKGKIIIAPPHYFPIFAEHCKADVFWNSASFQEMEPHVASNYLNLAVQMNCEDIYINALPAGNFWGVDHGSSGGTLEPVTEDVYFDALLHKYDLAATYCSDYFLRNEGYVSYIFKKK